MSAGMIRTQEEQLLIDWAKATQEAEKAKAVIAKEQELRKKVFSAFFKLPREGVNKEDLANGWILKGDYKLTRAIDEAALTANQKDLQEKGIPMDTLVVWKPELATSVYRRLTNDQIAEVDKAFLITKPASPTLTLVPPKAVE